MHKGTFAVSRAFDDVITNPTLLAIVYGVLDEVKVDDYPHASEMNHYMSQMDIDADSKRIKCNIMIKCSVLWPNN
jgi:hypothetical protein